MKFIMENETICQISTLLALLEGCLSRVKSNTSSVYQMEQIFLYCLSWSLGGLLHENDRNAFDALLRTISPDAMPPKV